MEDNAQAFVKDIHTQLILNSQKDSFVTEAFISTFQTTTEEEETTDLQIFTKDQQTTTMHSIDNIHNV